MEIVKEQDGAEISAETKPKVEIPLEKFPSIIARSKEITKGQDLIDCLNARKLIIIEGEEGLSNFEKNERKILLLKTDFDLAKTHTLIIQKKNSVKEYLDKIVYPYFNEIDSELEKVIKKIKERANRDVNVATFLNDTRFNLFEDNWEHKFNFYITAKNYLSTNRILKKV